MELTEFKDALKNELIKRGVSEDNAATGVAGLTKTITEEKRVMIERISSSDDLGRFADALARKIASEQEAAQAAAQKAAEQKAAQAVAQKAAEQKAAQAAAKKAAEQKTAQAAAKKTAQPTAPKQIKPTQARNPADQPTAQFKTQSKQPSASTVNFVPVKPNGTAAVRQSAASANSRQKQSARQSGKMDRGDKILLAVLILGAPIWFLGICVMSIPLVICYVGIVLMMAICIMLLIAIASAGVAVSLIGIVYGIIKLYSVPVEGAYELGLAAIIGGSALLICILLYNLAVRYIPRLFPIAKQLFSLEAAKITDIYYYVKKVCHNI